MKNFLNFLKRLKFSSPIGLKRQFAKFLNHYDRLLLALLSVVIVITGTIWFNQYSRGQGGPNTGGTYVQGIVGDSSEADAIAAEITKIGLFHLTSTGELQNFLIDSWSANEDKTIYNFVLKKDVNPDQIVTDLSNSVDLFGAASFENNGQNLKVTLPDSNPNLPLLMAQPLFDYGPYKLSKTSGSTYIFTRNPSPLAEAANLNTIIIHRYNSQEELQDALKKKKIDGAYYSNGLKVPSGYQTKTINLSRYYAVILNVNKSPFRDDAYRQNLLNGQSVAAKEFTLTVPDQEPQKTLANELVIAWQNQGAKVTLDVKSLSEVRDTVAPTRNFQAMIIGIDYGAELDPYYLWDSSQIRPPSNNLSGVKSDKIDGAIAQIRATYNVNERRNLIDGLHQLLLTQGIAKILHQETVPYVISDKINMFNPPIPQASHDLVQALDEWWLQ